ncbi:DNA polymerase III, alpha subunit [Lacrimispora sphenoides]|uniref:PHP domain-containing protein n=1 Tax=Lacrimispora sphenoides TaxID=29370 RepID=UPI0008C70334|nr:PHP domain-containing protein [Lacrimispora sphenoides]SEU09774.1 DNA polymerase III, alpha subunit [Lacrimispora sphenoides]
MSLLEDAKKAVGRLNFKFPYALETWINDMNMLMENYHKHTTWSDLIQIDSATDIHEFMEHSNSYGCQCYFSGEHGYPGEWLYVYDVCKNSQDVEYRKKHKLSKEIKFRYSAEVYWVKDINEINREEYVDKKGKTQVSEKRDKTNCHMVIVARTYHAMRKLNYIISCAHGEGFYAKPRIDLNMLFQLDKDDVYITSACVAGWKYENAEDIWLKIWEHFGDNFFLEYQTHNTMPQKLLNDRIYKMSKKYGIQTIVGLDTHYINEEDRIKRENLLQRKGQHYDDEEGWYMDFPIGKETYRRLIEQAVLPSEEIVYAMMNTHVFIDGCEELTYKTNFKIPIAPMYEQYNYDERVKILKDILYEKYGEEDIDHRTKDREEGMLYEHGEIESSGTTDYFLTNYELVKLAVNKYGGQLTTTSRGSASSYYSSKLLGFTTMDRFESEVPIYPERFITKDRILSSHQMPDIDFNVSNQEPFVFAGRELVGEHGCYPLLAVGKLGEKSGFKLYADIKGLEPSVANEITSSIDQYNEALKQVDDEEDKKDIHIEDYITNKEHLKIFNDSKPYQGIIEQAKVHACGFFLFNGNLEEQDVIGYGDIRYEIGLIRCHSESTGKSTVVANIEGGLLDSYGYVKDDFLIVDVVGIIHKLYESIGRKVPTVAELRKMVSEDEKVWKLYEIGATCCLNQCEKASTTKKVMKFKPKNIKELAAFIAGIRPGFKSLIDGFLNRIDYSNGEKAIDKLLEDCFHYMLYQEAVMKIFSYLGIPMKDSYDTIKKISKKKLKGEALAKVETSLKEHWLQNIGNLDNFEPVYKVIKDSARYSFNAPHALAMANDSLYEAWPKAHYLSKFYEVTLNHYQDKGDKNKVAALTKEAMTMFGYTMGTYEYGKDNTKFTVDDESKIIYPNLSSVKGIGEKAVRAIMDIYEQGVDDFVDIYVSIKGTNINVTVFKDLVKIGYFNKFGSIKKLLTITGIVDYWKGSEGKGRKTVKKAEIPDLHIDEEIVKKYATDRLASGKISDAQYSNLNWVGLCKELASYIDEEEFGVIQLVKFQYEVLGYVDYVDDTLEWRYVVITDINTTYSPKFNAYSIGKGKTTEMKIHKTINKRDKAIKTSFNEIPVQDGDIIYIKDVKKQPKKQKVNDEWQIVPDVYEWWIKDYIKMA